VGLVGSSTYIYKLSRAQECCTLGIITLLVNQEFRKKTIYEVASAGAFQGVKCAFQCDFHNVPLMGFVGHVR